MNKILIENDNISFDNEEVDVNFKNKSVILNITNKVTINVLEINNSLENLIININDNSSLTLNVFNENANLNLDVVINLAENSIFHGNIGLIGFTENNLNITTNMYKNNIINDLNIKGISKKEGKFNIRVDGKVIKDTYNNIMKESIKILNLNGQKSRILPNMLVATNEVKADHFVTISSISLDELFYLMSKGINKSLATKLLEKAFIFSLYSEDIQKIVNPGR